MRKLALFALGFSAAILLCRYFPGKLLFAVLICIGALAAAVGIAVKGSKANKIRVLALGVIIGCVWNAAYSRLFFAPAEMLDGYSGKVKAVVTDYPQSTEYGEKAEIKLYLPDAVDPKAVLYMYYTEYKELEPGDVIELNVKIVSASKKTENDYFESRGIPLLAYAESVPDVVGKVGYDKLRFFHKRLAKAVKNKISDIFPPFAVPFMTAVLVGDRTLLNSETYMFSVLSVTGTAHVVAVSGMHVAFLTSLLTFILGRRRRTAPVFISVIIIFMAMTGFSPSVVRAGIMQIIIISANLFRREYDDITSIFTALLILLAINPASVKNSGLQLSFAATFGIILFSKRLYSAFYRPFGKDGRFSRIGSIRFARKAVSFVCAALSSSLSALVFTVPISALMYGYVSIIAPAANILILWAVSLAFFSGVICVIIGFIFLSAAAVTAWVPSAMVWYISKAASVMAKIPFACVYTNSVYIRVWLVFMYAEAAALVAFRRLRGRISIFAASNIIVLGLAVGLNFRETRLSELSAAILDVGQGQCIVISSRGKTVVVDCGGNLMANAGDVAAEYLASIGETKIDAIILTHFHSDHANGAAELMRRVEVDTLIIPVVEDYDGYGEYIRSVAHDMDIDIIAVDNKAIEYENGGAEVNIIPPLGGKKINEMGLSVLCSAGEFDILITGDMNYDTEYRMLEYMPMPDIELLVAGHHGSKYSTSQRLLDETRPETVVISVSGDNNYGHPADETLERIEQTGAAVYRTDENGTITIRLAKGEQYG